MDSIHNISKYSHYFNQIPKIFTKVFKIFRFQLSIAEVAASVDKEKLQVVWSDGQVGLDSLLMNMDRFVTVFI